MKPKQSENRTVSHSDLTKKDPFGSLRLSLLLFFPLMAQRQLCGPTHWFDYRNGEKSWKLFGPDSDVSMDCQQQSMAVKIQKAPVVWGDGGYGVGVTRLDCFRGTWLGATLNSTRYLTTRVKQRLCRRRERSSLHAGHPKAHHTFIHTYIHSGKDFPFNNVSQTIEPLWFNTERRLWWWNAEQEEDWRDRERSTKDGM